jgi:methionine-rich copper-binding protein CopC
MSQGIHTTPVRLLAASAAAIALAFAALFVFAPPASAHDELIASDPAADSTVEGLPSVLTLTYSAYIASDAGASEVAVTDASGTSLTDGAPTVDGAVLTQPLTGSASGAITVLWKVVSSDGHPISGEFTFTATAAPQPEPTASNSAEPSESAEPTPIAAPVTPEATASPIAEDPNMAAVDMRPWYIAGIVLLIAVAGSVLYLTISRRRRDQALAATDPTAENPGSDTPTER